MNEHLAHQKSRHFCFNRKPFSLSPQFPFLSLSSILPPSEMPPPSTPRRRPRAPRLSEDLIKTIAQTIPNLPPLKSEIPKQLASDAEHHLRNVIRRAKCFMKHSRRTTLTVEDVSHAYKRRDAQPFLGYGGGGSDVTVWGGEFGRVAPGIFVEIDEIVELEQVLTADLPRVGGGVAIEGGWMVVGGGDGGGAIGDIVERLEGGKMDGILERVDKIRQGGGMGKLVACVVRRIDEEARAGGNSEVLANCCLVIFAMFQGSSFGVEVYVDVLMRALLTCLLAKFLGRGDHWGVRDLAAVVVQDALGDVDCVVRGRVGKTIVAVLTDKESGFESVYGAIRGLSAMGKEVFEMQMLPHLSALLEALEKATEGCEGLDGEMREDVEEKMAYVCRAIQEATGGDESSAGDERGS